MAFLYSIFNYQDEISSLIYRLKYGGELYLVPYLAQFIADKIILPELNPKTHPTVEITANGIYIKSLYKKNLIVNLSTNVRSDSGTGGLKYFRIELWRNGSMIESQFTATEVTNNGRANLTIPCFFKVTYNDIIKIKGYGKPSDTFLLTRANLELTKNDNIDYYNF